MVDMAGTEYTLEAEIWDTKQGEKESGRQTSARADMGQTEVLLAVN
jgi:hypothetical protein